MSQMSQILKLYQEEYGKRPNSPQLLVKFSKSRDDLKSMSIDEARKALGIRRRVK